MAKATKPKGNIMIDPHEYRLLADFICANWSLFCVYAQNHEDLGEASAKELLNKLEEKANG